jgi:hypothetical protein
MRKSRTWIWIIGGVAVVVSASIAWPLIVSAQRPKQLTFKVQDVYSRPATVKDAFSITGMTRSSVVVEGPCDGGCTGGILSQQVPRDVKEFIPDLQGYDGETNTIIWLYQIKPVEVSRHNDLFGEDTVTITGIQIKEQMVYLAVVPKHIVEPRLQWVYVQTK